MIVLEWFSTRHMHCSIFKITEITLRDVHVFDKGLYDFVWQSTTVAIPYSSDVSEIQREIVVEGKSRNFHLYSVFEATEFRNSD